MPKKLQQQVGLKLFKWSILILLIIAVIGTQALSDSTKRNRRLSEVEKNILIEPKAFSAEFLQYADFGFHQVVADFIWLELIQYFGGGDFTKRYYALPDLLNTITDLDPKFIYPHTFGMLVLPHQGDVDEAIALGEKGVKNNPGYGLIPYYLGSLYHQDKGDYEKAAVAYQKAAQDPETPEAARVLAGVSLSNLDKKVAAIKWWEGIIETTEPGSYQHERAKIWHEHILMQVLLENAVTEYKNKVGAYPENLDQLVLENYIQSIPESPLGVSFILDPETGKVDYKKTKYEGSVEVGN